MVGKRPPKRPLAAIAADREGETMRRSNSRERMKGVRLQAWLQQYQVLFDFRAPASCTVPILGGICIRDAFPGTRSAVYQ